MLIGEYTSKLQEKNRVAMPKKFRSEIGEKIIITKGYEIAQGISTSTTIILLLILQLLYHNRVLPKYLVQFHLCHTEQL